MPLYDFECKNCGNFLEDELQSEMTEPKCPNCGTQMTYIPGGFAFSMIPGAISKFKRKVGNTLPPEYKTTGGANVYGKRRKS